MLWVDKHRPNALEKLSYHAELGERLGSMAEDGDIPHLLFYAGLLVRARRRACSAC